jgi:ribosomal protein S15P/S13E
MVGRVTDDDIKGSPFYVDSFSTSIVHTIHTLFTGIPMRYNVHEDYMEFKDNSTTFILDPKVEIRKILLNDQVFSVEPYDDHGKIRLGYFFELDSNGVKLLKKKVIRFQERIPAKALQGSSTPPSYIPAADIFYYRVAGQAAQPIHNVKKMIEHFPDHKKELLSMANRHKIKSNEKDLVQLWEYYNKIRIKK